MRQLVGEKKKSPKSEYSQMAIDCAAARRLTSMKHSWHFWRSLVRLVDCVSTRKNYWQLKPEIKQSAANVNNLQCKQYAEVG